MAENGAVISVLRETHEPSPEVSRELLRGGLNRYGEPNYRAVWGQSRLDWIGGKWEDFDDNGTCTRSVIEVRHVPKYACDRWIIERWMPAEFYGSPEAWEMQTFETVDGLPVPALGPYPSRGDYELAFKLEDRLGRFVQLTPFIARAFIARLETSRESSKISRTERRSLAEEKDSREYESYADSVLNTGSTITGPSVSVL